MNFAAELNHFNLDPALSTWLAAQMAERESALETQAQVQETLKAQVQTQRAEIQLKDQELRNKDLKIQALTLELAHHKRIRFGCKSEALSAKQGDLFEETWQVDLEAIHEETKQLQPEKNAKNINRLAATSYLRNYPVSNTVMNLTPASVANVAKA